MLDIKLIREKPDLVRENLKKRGDKTALDTLDGTIYHDNEWRKIVDKLNSLRAERNTLSKQVAELRKEGEDASDFIEKTKQMLADIQKLESREDVLRIAIDNNMQSLPNILHESVPPGKDESENVEVRSWGEPREFDFPVKNHVELIEDLGLADFESSAKTSGAGFYLLKGDLALLDQALIRFAVEHMVKKGYVYIEPPLLLYEDILRAALDMEGFEQSIYKVDQDDLCLIGTSEYSLLGMHADEVIPEHELPKKYFAYTMCFRKEIGSHGINERGLWRTHQFNKVEQFVFCKPEDSDKYYDEMMVISEEIYRALGLPYRVVESCSGDLAMWKARGSDIEVWRPTTGDYGEICSLSDCTDYQARNLRIRTILPDGTRVVPHTINNTVLATSRTMVAILENYQNEDGTVTVPEALRPLIEGKEAIGD
jgi:seryl-tRNA synthetase